MGKKLRMMKIVLLQFVASIVILSLCACTNDEQNQKSNSNVVETNVTSPDILMENPEPIETENELDISGSEEIKIVNDTTMNEEILNHNSGIQTSTIASVAWDVQAAQNFIQKTDEAVISIRRRIDKSVPIRYPDSDYPTYALKDCRNPDELERYLKDYFTEDLLDYVLLMYRFEQWNGFYGFDPEQEDLGYQIDPMGEFFIIEQTENQCVVSVPFQYNGLMDITPIKSNGSITIGQQSNGEWKITQISQWYTDFYYYYMDREELRLYDMDKEEFDQLIRDFGTDEKGNMVSMNINCDENRVILEESNTRLLTEMDLVNLTKFGKYLAYHEIYARHGKIFEDKVLDIYFIWKYNIQKDIVWENVLSEIEKENLKFIEERIK